MTGKFHLSVIFIFKTHLIFAPSSRPDVLLITNLLRIMETSKWTAEEDAYLAAHFKQKKKAELARALNRTRNAVQTRLYKLRLVRGDRRPWTHREDNYLRRHYLTMKNRELGQALGRSLFAVYSRLTKLGIERPAEVRERLQASTQFQKGQTPFNKGLKGIHHSPATEFKPGHRPANTKYDGCIRLRYHKRSKHPMKFIRIAKMVWVPLHRHIWEKKHGPIPAGHLISFKDGNSMNCKLSNLRLISKAENALRNRDYEKARAKMRENWQQLRHLKSDNYVAHLLAGRDKRLKKIVAEQPDLLELKRLQIKLRRNINESHHQKAG